VVAAVWVVVLGGFLERMGGMKIGGVAKGGEVQVRKEGGGIELHLRQAHCLKMPQCLP